MIPLEECMLIFSILGEGHCCRSIALGGCATVNVEFSPPPSGTYWSSSLSLSYFLEAATQKEMHRSVCACVYAYMFACYLFRIISS